MSRVSLLIGQPARKKIERIAAARGLPLAETIRRLLDSALDAEEQRKRQERQAKP